MNLNVVGQTILCAVRYNAIENINPIVVVQHLVGFSPRRNSKELGAQFQVYTNEDRSFDTKSS